MQALIGFFFFEKWDNRDGILRSSLLRGLADPLKVLITGTDGIDLTIIMY